MEKIESILITFYIDAKQLRGGKKNSTWIQYKEKKTISMFHPKVIFAVGFIHGVYGRTIGKSYLTSLRNVTKEDTRYLTWLNLLNFLNTYNT